jgi:hypothetical protein
VNNIDSTTEPETHRSIQVEVALDSIIARDRADSEFFSGLLD